MWRNPKTSCGLQSPSSSENATSRLGDGNGDFGSGSMSYQTIRQDLRPHTGMLALSPVQIADDFQRATRDGIRQLRDRSDGLTKKEAWALDDLNRDRGLAMVRHALSIARYRATCPAAATGLLENWRGFVLAGHAVNCPVIEAFRWETDAQGDFDLAQLNYANNPTEVNRQIAIEKGSKHMAEIRRALDALHGVRR